MSRLPHLSLVALLLMPFGAAQAAVGDAVPRLTDHWVGFTAIAIFVVAYLLVMGEEFTHLRKSKPVNLAAGLIWAVIAVVYGELGFSQEATRR